MGLPQNLIGCVVVPVAILGMAAVASVVPEHVIGGLQASGIPMPSEKSFWSTALTLIVQAIGLIVLPAFGERLGGKALGYLRGLLP